MRVVFEGAMPFFLFEIILKKFIISIDICRTARYNKSIEREVR